MRDRAEEEGLDGDGVGHERARRRGVAVCGLQRALGLRPQRLLPLLHVTLQLLALGVGQVVEALGLAAHAPARVGALHGVGRALRQQLPAPVVLGPLSCLGHARVQLQRVIGHRPRRDVECRCSMLLLTLEHISTRPLTFSAAEAAELTAALWARWVWTMEVPSENCVQTSGGYTRCTTTMVRGMGPPPGTAPLSGRSVDRCRVRPSRAAGGALRNSGRGASE